MLIRPLCDTDLPEVCTIFNDAVCHTDAVWTTQKSSLAERSQWLARIRQTGGALAAVNSERLAGYAAFFPWRSMPGSSATAEISIYVAADFRQRGVGKALLAALAECAKNQGIHVLVAAITADNRASIALHEACGFASCGIMPQVGRKRGRWLDLLWMCRILDNNPPPPDGLPEK